MGKSVRIFMCISGFSNRSTLDRIINFEKNIIPKNRNFGMDILERRKFVVYMVLDTLLQPRCKNGNFKALKYQNTQPAS